jgi:hypothetical protein
MNKKLGSRVSALLFASAIALVTPATAFAADGPGDGMAYQDTRSGVDSNGSWTVDRTSCAGANGEASFEKTETRATSNGQTTQVVRTGDQAACAQASEESASQDNAAVADNASSNSAERSNGVVGVLFGDMFGIGTGGPFSVATR